MSTNKPMSDGGKGSVRRNEDTEAYRNNYDAIFGNKKDKKPMINEHEQDETEICHHCSGSGEGRYEGTTCQWCYGYGEVPVDPEEESDAEDDNYE